MFSITALNSSLTAPLQHRIDQKTKPPGSLGKLEALALRIGQIQNTLEPSLQRPHMLLFAGDHGITAEGVSPFPQEVTAQMVLNFLNGGAAINVFCRQNALDIRVINAGVAHPLPEHPQLIDARIAAGTRNFLHEAAMSREQCQQALTTGAELVRGLYDQGCNVIGCGEMGIGNTSAAATLMHRFTGLPLEQCVGRGTGLDEAGLQHKLTVLQQAVQQHAAVTDPLDVLATFGGFEIAMMCGAMLQAAELRMLVLIDGFIATSALLAAHAMHPQVLDYCVFCHQSDEQGHRLMLEYLQADPLQHLDLRLGEGTGAALAYPLVQAAVNFLNEMASFEDAAVSQQEDTKN